MGTFVFAHENDVFDIHQIYTYLTWVPACYVTSQYHRIKLPGDQKNSSQQNVSKEAFGWIFYTWVEIYLTVRNFTYPEFGLTNDATKIPVWCKIFTVKKTLCWRLASGNLVPWLSSNIFAKQQESNRLCVIYCGSGFKCHPNPSMCSNSSFWKKLYIGNTKMLLPSQYCKGMKKRFWITLCFWNKKIDILMKLLLNSPERDRAKKQ